VDRLIDTTPANRLAAFLDNQKACLQKVEATEMTQVEGGFATNPVAPLIAAILRLLRLN
jgi:hypothetical protein